MLRMSAKGMWGTRRMLQKTSDRVLRRQVEVKKSLRNLFKTLSVAKCVLCLMSSKERNRLFFGHRSLSAFCAHGRLLGVPHNLIPAENQGTKGPWPDSGTFSVRSAWVTGQPKPRVIWWLVSARCCSAKRMTPIATSFAVASQTANPAWL